MMTPSIRIKTKVLYVSQMKVKTVCKKKVIRMNNQTLVKKATILIKISVHTK